MKKKIIEFMPFAVALLFSIITVTVYTVTFEKIEAVRILETCVAPLIPLAIPILNRIFKIRIPFALNIALTVFAIIAIDFASVLDFYAKITYLDKFLHAAFGVVGAFCVAVFLLYGNGNKMKPWCFFITVMFAVLGLAAAWEIIEYIMHALIGMDTQRWMPDMGAVGDMTVKDFFADYNPLWDTMWDIIVAVFGVIVFYALVLIDKLCGYKVCKSVYAQVSYRAPKKEEINDDNCRV